MFGILLVLGLVSGRLGEIKGLLLVALWLVGLVGLPRLAWWASSLVSSWVAILDMVLVFIAFKGDVTLT